MNGLFRATVSCVRMGRGAGPVLVVLGLLVAAILPVPGMAADEPPVGKWEIVRKPEWVVKNYLAFRSDVYAFAEHGNCLWGAAHGTCEMLPDGKMKVSFPLQEATPGFTGVFEVRVDGETLTLTDTVRPEPIVLRRWLDMGKLVGETAERVGALLRERKVPHTMNRTSNESFVVITPGFKAGDTADWAFEADFAIEDVLAATERVVFGEPGGRERRAIPERYDGPMYLEVVFPIHAADEINPSLVIRPESFSAESVTVFMRSYTDGVREGNKVRYTAGKAELVATAPTDQLFQVMKNIILYNLTGALLRRYTVKTDDPKTFAVEVPNVNAKAEPLRIEVVREVE